jgi:TetR/AcrR family transcriptional regulator
MYDADPTGLDDTSTVDGVIEVAIEQFSEHGFPETRLDNIARISGMSKRMIHYHFGDKRGLYHRCLAEAVERITPVSEEMIADTTVPVEGVTKLVDAVYSRLIRHPECVRLLAMESLQQVMGLRELAHLHNQSEIVLHLDRLLMLGQDAGAFRPGIAAEDLFYLIGSLSFYRLTNRDLMINLFDLDPSSEENTEGVRRMIVDTVLSFLTANIRDSGHDSYLVADMVGDDEPQSALGIYDAEDLS